jgi:Ca2+-binding EF-hand superfamily protein
LDEYEFKKAIKDFRIPIQEKDLNRLFNIFDRDRSGRINYDEFLRGVRGEMN